MVHVDAPQDGEIAVLNRSIGETLIGFGRAADRRAVVAKQAASEAAPASSAADRLTYNAATGRVVQGEGELIDAIARDEVKLADVKTEELPEELRSLTPEAREAAVEAKRAKRKELQSKLDTLLAARNAHIVTERKRLAEEGKGDTFDAEVATTVREQAARKGITYGK